MEFHHTVDKITGNQHLQFTAEICTNDKNLPHSAKNDRVKIVKNYKFPFLGMKIIWSPEGGLQFGLFSKKGQQLKYIGIGITHTPSTICAILSGVLNCLVKFTFVKTLF